MSCAVLCVCVSQMKELNESLRTEKSSRTDLEMYVAVLNTQKTVLQDDTDKLRAELQEGRWCCCIPGVAQALSSRGLHNND